METRLFLLFLSEGFQLVLVYCFETLKALIYSYKIQILITNRLNSFNAIHAFMVLLSFISQCRYIFKNKEIDLEGQLEIEVGAHLMTSKTLFSLNLQMRK